MVWTGTDDDRFNHNRREKLNTDEQSIRFSIQLSVLAGTKETWKPLLGALLQI